MVTIVGGAVAALLATGVVAIFNKPVRERFWKPIGRLLWWPFTFRITTAKRQAVERDTVNELKRELGHVIEAAVKAQRDGETATEAARREGEAQAMKTQEIAQQEALKRHKNYQQQIETAREFGREEGRASAFAEVEAQRAVPLPQPVWRVDGVEGSDAFVLRNTQPDVVVSDLSLQAPLGDFVFSGPSQWPGSSTGVVTFHGDRQRHGRAFGVKFVVRWRDANGDPRVGEAFLDKEPHRAIVL